MAGPAWWPICSRGDGPCRAGAVSKLSSGSDRPIGVVGLELRRTPEGEEAVARVFVDDAAARLDDGADPGQDRVEIGGGFLGCAQPRTR